MTPSAKCVTKRDRSRIYKKKGERKGRNVKKKMLCHLFLNQRLHASTVPYVIFFSLFTLSLGASVNMLPLIHKLHKVQFKPNECLELWSSNTYDFERGHPSSVKTYNSVCYIMLSWMYCITLLQYTYLALCIVFATSARACMMSISWAPTSSFPCCEWC